MMMRRASVNGVSLAYDVRGSGPPLVLIMGYRLSSAAWPAEFVTALAEQFTLLLFDNRGTGLSDKPTSGYALSNMANDVIGLMDHLDIPRANVVGYSMGGAIAQELVCRHPDRALSLVLVANSLRWIKGDLCEISRDELNAQFGEDDAVGCGAPHLDGHVRARLSGGEP